MAEAAEAQSRTVRDGIAIGSMIAMVMLVLFRAMTTHEPFPMWDSDPYLFGTPITGITAGYGILLNTIVMLLSLVVLAVVTTDGSRGGRWMRGLLGVGYAGLCVHMALDPGTVMDGSTLGAMIGATVASAVFIRTYPEWIRVLVPVVLGSGVVLAVYGAHQVFIQHPRTVDMYEASRVPFLEARGWTEGSFEAMTYERRLRQPEPTGWFGLSNVLASFMGAFGVAMLMVTLSSLRRAWWIASGLLAGMLLAILLISKSKGGIGAAVLGFGTLQYALALHRGRATRIGTGTLGACVLVMIGVVGGAIVHQLSLLFRAQYMIGAMRIFAEHPILGVGPGRFQNAYMILKPATSPEDVTSAHNLVFDLLSQLGIAGIAWIGVLVVLIWSSRLPIKLTETVHLEADASNEIGRRTLVRVILLMAIFVGIAMIRVQTASLDLELMLILLGAVGLWIAVAVLLGVLGSVRALRLAMLGAAVVLVIHAMLDLTPVMIVSAPLFGICLGIGFGPGASDRSGIGSTGRISAATLIAVLGLGAGCVVAVLGGLSRIERDRALINIAEPAVEVSQIRMLLDSQSDPAILANRTAGLTQIPTESTHGSIKRNLEEFTFRQRPQSTRRLIELSSRYPQNTDLRITALEQAMKTAVMLDDQMSPTSGEFWEYIQKVALQLSRRGISYTEQKWAGHARLHLARHRAGSPEESMEFKELAYQDWVRADAFAPHNPVHAIRLMDLAIELGHQDEARAWAARAIDRSERMRLDPLKQLGASDRSRAQKLLAGTISEPAQP